MEPARIWASIFWAGDDGIDSPTFMLPRSKLLTEYLPSYLRLSVSNITIAAWSLFSPSMHVKLLCVSMTALWNRTHVTRPKCHGEQPPSYNQLQVERERRVGGRIS